MMVTKKMHIKYKSSSNHLLKYLHLHSLPFRKMFRSLLIHSFGSYRIESNEWISVLIGHHCLIVKKKAIWILFFTIRVWLRPWRLVNHWGLACWHELIFYIFLYIWVICINVCLFFLFLDVSFEQYLI